jgi:hypothetical protein
MAYRVVAFDKDWKFKGYIDPSIRDDVVWIRAEDAFNYIRTNKPEDEHWLVEADWGVQMI